MHDGEHKTKWALASRAIIAGVLEQIGEDAQIT